MSELLSALSYYGYGVPEVDYDEWKTKLEEFVSASSVEKDQKQSALMPLFYMATSDLLSTTRASELDGRATLIAGRALMKALARALLARILEDI